MKQGTQQITRRQHGVVAVYVAIALVALLTGVFVAFEVGRIYMGNRQLQKMASLAALDAVREVSACDRELDLTPTQIQQQLSNRVNESLRRNGGDALFSTLTVTTETGNIAVVTSTGGQDVRALTQTRLNAAGGTETIPVEDASAVRVTLNGPFPGLLTGLGPADGGRRMEVSATAEQPVQGTFQVGSGLASLSGGAVNSLLSALLGGDVNINVVDFQTGLANVNVTVELLATALGVSVQDLSNPLALSTQTIVLSEALDGLADGLSGTASATVINLLRSLADDAANTRSIPLDQLLGDLDSASPDTPLINLRDLVMALAQAANADPTGALSPIELRNFGPSLAGTTIKTYLKILEPAQIGKGRPGEAEARTAQIRLMIRIDGGPLVNGLTTTINTLLAVLGASVAPQGLKIGIDVEVAQGLATLDRIQCPKTGTNNGEPIAELSARTGLATVSVGSYAGSAEFTPPPLISGSTFPLLALNLNLGLLGRGTLTAGLGLTSAGVSQTGPNPLPLDVTQFTRLPDTGENLPTVFIADGIPPAIPVTGNPQKVGSDTSVSLNLALNVQNGPGNTGLVAVTFNLVAGLFTAVSGAVQNLLGLVNTLAATLIDPLLGALGLSLGTATVTMESITVDRPVVVSTLRAQATPAP